MSFHVVHSMSGECISDRVEIARTFSKRFIGLMGRKAIAKGQGLYFPGCTSIHCFFMRFSIDVLFLDKEMRITKMVHNLKPYRVAFSPRGTRHTLELSSGVLKNHQMTVGDAIELIHSDRKGHNYNADR